MILSEAEAGLSLLSRLLSWIRVGRTRDDETVAGRFFQVFENHGVHRNQIPRFFGHGLSLRDVQDDASLMARLDESTLDAVCELFAVRREWLDGAEKQVHPCHDFYKDPKAFHAFIQELKAKTPAGCLEGVLLAPDKDKHVWNKPALLILHETIGYIGNNPICRYHLCNNWNFRYWKSRAYLTACVAIAWKQKAYILGEYVPQKLIVQLEGGESLLGWKGEGIPRGRRWHPEDMALKPDEYLKGIDPERDNYGIRAGLAQWLDLEEEGWMDTDFEVAPRQTFERALEAVRKT